MPPNVKEVASVLKTLDVSGLTVRQKYLPLTHPLEQQQHEERQREEEEKKQSQDAEYETADHVDDASHPAQSYWDWESNNMTEADKKQKMISLILEEERIRQLLSIESIERTLVKQRKSGGECVSRTGADEAADYWDMPSGGEAEASCSPSLRTDCIVDNLVEAAALLKQRESSGDYVYASHVGDESHPAHAYWDEGECYSSEEEKRRSLIQSILAEEQCRLAVELGAVERGLLKGASLRRDDAAAAPASAESAEYWYWKCAPPAVIEASHVEDESHPANAYWDWKTHTVCEIKEKMINEIMEEEKIRVLLSVDHVEETEALRASSGQEEAKEAEVVRREANEGVESYWEW